MAGYTRQSLATIQPGLDIDAEPFNDEFNAVQAAFDNSTGHDHSGLFPGDGAKVALPTAVTGILPVANGGTGVALSTGTVKVVLSTSPTILTPVIASITGPTTVTTGGLTISTGGLTVTAGGASITGVTGITGATTITGALTVTTTATLPTIIGPTTLTTGGLTISTGGATITGTTGITGATTVTGTFNATTSVSDGGSRVFSLNNLLGNSAAGQTNPTGTASAVGVMAGMAYSFTSSKTGRMLIVITGILQNNTNTTQASASLRFSTGAAPANGAPIAGTSFGGLALADIVTGGYSIPFTCTGVLTGLTIGTAYWLDIVQASPSGVGTARLLNLFVEAVEI